MASDACRLSLAFLPWAANVATREITGHVVDLYGFIYRVDKSPLRSSSVKLTGNPSIMIIKIFSAGRPWVINGYYFYKV